MSIIVDVLKTLWKPFDWYLNDYKGSNPRISKLYDQIKRDGDPSYDEAVELSKDARITKVELGPNL